MREQPAFLPMFWSEAEALGIDQLDVVLISGDAYVDHPSFAAALVGRVLWDADYSAGIIAHPIIKRLQGLTRLKMHGFIRDIPGMRHMINIPYK
jgi:hypothetical protein